MKLKSRKDFFAGLMFTLVGAGFAWGATTYTVGSGARMGPGYFPLLLGIVLTLLGGFILFESLVVETEDGEKIGKWAWKPLGFILLANFAFGVLLGGLPSLHVPAMGMIVAIIALTFIAALAGDEFNWKEIAVLSVVLNVVPDTTFVAPVVESISGLKVIVPEPCTVHTPGAVPVMVYAAVVPAHAGATSTALATAVPIKYLMARPI